MTYLNKFRDARIVMVAIFLLSACSTTETTSIKKHHTPDGYVNNALQDSPSVGDALDFAWQRLTSDTKKLEYPIAQNDPVFLQKNTRKSTITWIGHTTFLIQMGGINILTDPHFSERASPISWAGPKRYTPPGISLEELPLIDFVILSHNHYDHLDLATIRQLQEKQSQNPPLFFVPLGLKSWFNNIGIENVKELDWGDHDKFKTLTIHSVPLQHYSSRTLWDRNETLWAGWVIEYNQRTIFFAGDTGYSKDFKEIGKSFGPIDLSLLPIGAYAPRRLMKPIHINPEEAVKIHQDVQSRYSIGMHWGTFLLTTEDMDEPPRHLKKALQEANVSETEFFLMKHGETRMLNFLLNK